MWWATFKQAASMRLFWYQVFIINSCIAIKVMEENRFWMVTTFQAVVAARLQRRQLWAAGPGPGGLLRMCRGKKWRELQYIQLQIQRNTNILCCLLHTLCWHQWNMDFESNFYWIPLKTTKFDFHSVKLSSHLLLLSECDCEGWRTLVVSPKSHNDCIVAIFTDYLSRWWHSILFVKM